MTGVDGRTFWTIPIMYLVRRYDARSAPAVVPGGVPVGQDLQVTGGVTVGDDVQVPGGVFLGKDVEVAVVLAGAMLWRRWRRRCGHGGSRVEVRPKSALQVAVREPHQHVQAVLALGPGVRPYNPSPKNVRNFRVDYLFWILQPPGITNLNCTLFYKVVTYEERAHPHITILFLGTQISYTLENKITFLSSFLNVFSTLGTSVKPEATV